MLQIATGMYFRDVELYETLQRRTYFTNADVVEREPVPMPFGTLTFSTAHEHITSLAIEATERLEAVNLDGSPSFHMATGGEELLDDAATVFAFAANVTCSRHLHLVERVVPRILDSRPSRAPSSILRRTFDPSVPLADVDFEEIREFCERLLACRRDSYIAAMRAMRKVVDATMLVGDDPGLAYTLFVAALESLAQKTDAVEIAPDWNRYDHKKRRILEPALADLAEADAERIRTAILEADQLSLARRFKVFTTSHIRASYYRDEAAGVKHPLRAQDLPNALDLAYRVRSRNVHDLLDLEPELWVVSDRSDTLRWKGRWVLSLEGLNRLCRHVIRTFVDRAPTGIDQTFAYRDHLPGILRGLELAPEYWAGKHSNMSAKDAPRQFEGFVGVLMDMFAADKNVVRVDMNPVLARIETLLPTETGVSARRPMVAIYLLWHYLMAEDLRRPRSQEFVDAFVDDLNAPSIESFAVSVLLDGSPRWTADQWAALVGQRWSDLESGRGQRLPPRLDTALILSAAEALADSSRSGERIELIARAVESSPGDEELLEFERRARTGARTSLDLRKFTFGQVGWLDPTE